MNINPFQIPSYVDLVSTIDKHLVDSPSAKIAEVFALAAGCLGAMNSIVVDQTVAFGSQTFLQPSWIADKSSGVQTQYHVDMRAARTALADAETALRKVLSAGGFDQIYA